MTRSRSADGVHPAKVRPVGISRDAPAWGQTCRLATRFLLLAAAWHSAIPTQAATPKDYTVLVEATATENPPALVLSWPAEPKATGYQISRKLRTETNWGPALSVPRTARSWTDLSVTVGTQYEYQIRRTSTIASVASASLTSYGYLCAGIRLPPVDRRGTIVLVVDDSKSLPLAAELSRLQDDLVGDGWAVRRHDVARTASVTAVRALIKAEYDSAPQEVRAVLLFGHVPVPRSGEIAAGGHPDVHRGAFPADLYYGEMDGVWTDTKVNNKTAHASLSDCWNVPGDGKFDASYVPGATADFLPGGAVELEVGRVDLWGMTSFLPKTETDLLRQYLNKVHAHRHAVRVLPRRALITDNFGEFDGKAFAQGGWRSWSSLFGAANVVAGTFGTLKTNAYFGHYMNGPGDNNWCEPTHTADFAREDPQTAFVMMFGSHFSDWNKTDNILRAPLATTSGLASVYSGMPHWFLHVLSLGGSFGEATRLVQNNFYRAGAPDWPITYNPASSFVGGIHVSLHGDPTLRLLAVVPPTALKLITNRGGHPELSWTASPEASLGYHVYRANSTAGPFVRLTPEPVAQPTYVDTQVAAGTFTYQVKAARLETTAGGTFVNTSQAVTATVVLDEPIPRILSRVLADGTLQLSWPTRAAGYELQSVLPWNPSADWVSVPGIPLTEGDRQVVTVLPTETARYFRLARF